MSEDEARELERIDNSDSLLVQQLLVTVESGMDRFADAQKFAAQEATKRTEIVVKAANSWKWPVTGIGALVILLLGFSMYQGNFDLPEKVFAGLIGIVVGALGMKASSAPKSS